MVKCLRVPKTDGESVRSRLVSEDLLDLDSKIRAEGDFLLIPIRCDSFDGYEVLDRDLEVQEHKVSDYTEIAEVPQDLRESLPSSFDVVGDVAMIKIPDELWDYRHQIGDALIRVNRNIRVVFHDYGVKGDFRIRDLEKIAGEGSSETVHKEFGVKLYTDPSKVYFNPRLSSERSRIANLVKDGEVIIDMFAGVAPFGTVIGKLANPQVIYSIDLNPEAEHFARMNADKNHIECIRPMTGDSSKLIYDLPMADRVIMNLPQIADRFLGFAMDRMVSGATAHMYKIIERDEFPKFCDDLEKEMKEKGHRIEIHSSELKTYSPTMSVYSMDVVKL
ncbi:MAG: class I SAM-dependent methyltransferase family protein [Candidatus Methanomethylophilaceae archaeon]|nr:class I SAM-dependent methyltransferase family protein [Candidatus Methanomethylophilaceae archaeon]